MSQLHGKILSQLQRAYGVYFDIEPVEDGTALKALCSCHMRDSQYVLVKKAELWAAESHEYRYLWSLERLDEAGVAQIFQRVLDDGMPRVAPHSNHMSTLLTAIVLYDSAVPDALKQLKALKKRREFMLSLHGWVEFRIAAVDVSTVEVTTNRSGKAIEKELQQMVQRIRA